MAERNFYKASILFLRKYYMSVLMTGLILYLSFAPPSNFDQFKEISFFEGFDKLVHFVLYFSLAAVLMFESGVFKENRLNCLLVPGLLYPVVLGGLVELCQKYFFAPRSAEFFDWFFDISGVVTVWLIFIVYRKIKSACAK